MRKINFKFILCFLVFSVLLNSVFLFQKTESTQAGIFDAVFGEVEKVEGNYVNNLVIFNFLNESNNLINIVPENQIAIYDDVYNTNQFSLKSYYNQVSNGKLNLTTNFIEDGSNINVININKSREYFMNYCFYDNDLQQYVINEEGYFPYEIVSSESAPNPSLVFDIEFYMSAEHYGFVYGDSSNKNFILESSETGIYSYKQAEEFVANNEGYYIVDGIERYLRELELVSLLDDQLTGLIDLTNCDVNNDGNIDILSLNVLHDANKSYRIEWSELLWSHQSSLSAFLDYEIDLGFFSGTVTQLINISFAYNLIKSYISPHIKDSSYIDTYLNYAKSRPSISDGSESKNIDKYYLTTFDAQNFEGKTTFEEYKNVLRLSTTIHELGHVFGLPDLYIYNGSNSSDAVGSWSLMCSNTNPSQYLTAYEREKLGWLDENNIKTISSSGVYSLNATKGYDSSNVVAYKIQNPDNLNQWFYFEYRDKSLKENSYWESATGEGGLLVYRVDTSVLTGNMYALPYGMYVFRQDSIYTATFKEGQSFGNYDTTITKNSLNWVSDANIDINSGFVFNVLSLNDGVLTFNFETVKTYTTLQLKGASNIQLYIGDEYVESGFEIKENDVVVEFEQDETLSKNRTFKIEYYKGDEKIENIDTALSASYKIVYTIKDCYGEVQSVERIVNVVKKQTVGVALNGEDLIEIFLNETYQELGVTITHDGLNVSSQYKKVASEDELENGSYFIKTFLATESFDKIEEKTFSTTEEAFYLFEYIVQDIYGEKHIVNRYIIVTRFYEEVFVENEELLNRIQSIIGQEKVFTNSFLDFDYLNFSNLGLSNLNEILKFEFKDDVVIDLSNNNLVDLEQIKNIVIDYPNSTILLVNNNLTEEIINAFVNKQNLVFGFQKETNTLYFQSEVVDLGVQIIDDYQKFYNLYIDNVKVDSSFKFSTAGVHTLTLQSNGSLPLSSLTHSIEIVLIEKIDKDFSYSYASVKEFDLNDFISISNQEMIEYLTFETDYNSMDKTILDLQQFNISIFYDQEEIASYVYNFSVYDDIAPNIEIIQGTEICLLSKQDYDNFEIDYSKYITAVDEFQGELEIDIAKPTFSGYQTYSVECVATDDSGNSSTQVFSVRVGEIELIIDEQYEYNQQSFLKFNIINYEESDLIIKYRLGGYGYYQTYNDIHGAYFRLHGVNTLNIEVSYRYGNTKTNLAKSIYVVDTIIPELKLKGLAYETVKLNDDYIDPGIEVYDNTEYDKLNIEINIYQNGIKVNKINTKNASEFVIEYIVSDLGGNTATITRIVNVEGAGLDNNMKIVIAVVCFVASIWVMVIISVIVKKIKFKRQDEDFF